MQLKSILMSFIILILCSEYSFGQQKEISLINGFLESLFDEKIPASDLVTMYMPYDKESGSHEAAVSHIEEIRKGKELDRGWLMPNHKIANLSKFKIRKYLDFSDLDKVSFNNSKKQGKNMYVLLNDKEDEILQYFLIKDCKLVSFSLFGKGTDVWFFGYE